uniref:RNA-directed DNA polymerase n=1 Tax=Rhipicephalus pulchellus TaxID=72859 RepID=L7LV95_RHIPC
MNSNLRARLKKVLTPAPIAVVRVADGATPVVTGMCTARVTVAGRHTSVLFYVLEQCPHEIILGLDFLSSHSALIDCASGVVQLALPYAVEPRDPAPSKLCSADYVRVPSLAVTYIDVSPDPPVADGDYVVSPSATILCSQNVTFPHTVIRIQDNAACLPIVNFGLCPQVLPQGISLATLDPACDYHISALTGDKPSPTSPDLGRTTTPNLTKMIAADLPTEQVHALRELLASYQDIFDLNDRPLGQTTVVKHRINTGDANPIHRRPYRVSSTERQVIQTEVDKMLARNIIETSSSPWASPVVLVRKKDNSWRFCVDYRNLNKVTKKDVYPLPRIDDALDCLSGAKYFSSIDLRSGYWQIAVDEMDREKTAFITPDGLYQFKVMPFGLCNAPATFERMMDALLHGFKWSICLCYLDDVIVFSPTFETHIERLSTILSVFRKAGLQLNSSKCHFGRRQLTVLGHLVDSSGVRPDPEKVRAVKDFPVPTCANDVRSFVGLCSYFRRFVRNFADIARPLTELLKKDATFVWGPEQASAFAELTMRLTSPPILGHFDMSAPTEVRTDASGHGIGAVLAQRQHGSDRVIAYASRLLSPAERNYSITERECLALVWAVGKFRPYLYGRQFTVVTDHHALCWLSSLKDPSGRLGRWALRLQEYSFTVVYKTGRQHEDADCLSRHPVDPPDLPESGESTCVLALSAFANIGDEQRRDPHLRDIINRLSDPSTPSSLRLFVLQDGILYHYNMHPDGPDLLLVIPSHMRQTVLAQLHDVPTAGHLGVSRTYDRVRRRFFWPGIYRSVRRYVASCKPCQHRKTPATLPAGLLQPIEIPSQPFFKVGLDLLGPFPQSIGGNKWIAVATDYTTRYAITRAMPTSCATDVADFLLQDVILRHGAPRQLITDRGRYFLSKVVQDILHSCATKHKFTTAYHPQTNGLTERLNRTITDMLAMYVSPDHRDWDEALAFVTFAYNTSRHDSAGFSPFFLLYGREPTLPFDTLLPPIFDTTSEYARDAIGRAAEAREVARLRLNTSQEKQRRVYDARHRDIHFEPGDMVLLWTPSRRVGLCEKLISPYSGPYRVLRQVTDVTYEVEPLDTTIARSSEIVHVTRLKRYHTDQSSTGSVPSPPGVMLRGVIEDEDGDNMKEDDAR